MHERPPDLDDADIRRTLRTAWGIRAEVEYAAVGFGSHHWRATSETGRWFVTVDDLAHKPMLGRGASEVADRLSGAYRAARHLRESGLEFVVATLPVVDPPDGTTPDAALVVLHGLWAMSVLPHVVGTTWEFADSLPHARRDELVGLLARLHAAPLPAAGLRRDATPSGRVTLESLLASRDEPWRSGPYAEPARVWLAANAELVRDRLAELDASLGRVDAHDLVVTHGEPHPGNLIGTDDGLRLVDWDTVALAPRERDVWLVGGGEPTVAAYEAASGRTLDRELLAAYRLAWDLADVASFAEELHAPHVDTVDTRAALRFLTRLELAPLATA